MNKDKVIALLQESSVNTPTSDSSLIARRVQNIKDLKPCLSEVAGERLDIEVKNEGDRYCYTSNFTIRGAESNETYGTLSFTLENDKGELNLDPMSAVGLYLYCAINRAGDVPEWVMQALADRGIMMLGCDFCQASFATVKEACIHENTLHGTNHLIV